MSHLDEGQLNALLDGELAEAERKAAEAHLADCAECRLQYEEVRALLAQADELIAEIQLPPASRPDALPGPIPVPRSGRRLPWNYLAWAATVMLAVGLGWYGSELRYRSEARAPEGPGLAADTLGKSAVSPATATVAETAARTAQPLAQAGVPAPAAAKAVPASPAPRPAEPSQGFADATRAPEPARDLAAGRAEVAQNAPEPGRGAPAETREQEGKVAAQNGVIGAVAAPERLVPNALAARKQEPVGGLRRVDLATAVRMLGGTIRLVDGLTPTAVLAGPGTAVAGADPEADLVRVVYEDPPSRELWLDQQRSAGREETDRRSDTLRGTTALLLGDTLVTPGKGGVRNLRWLDQGGFRLGLTGFLPADSLRALARRVQ